MATEVTHEATVYKLWAWFEANKKQAAWVAVGLVGGGLVIGFILWQQGAKQDAAGDAFSKVFVPQALASGQRVDLPEPYLKLAAEYPNSQAGVRAQLLGAGALFVAGKFAEAQVQFGKFSREHRDSPMLGQALLGVAACLQAQGKTDEAVTAYKDLVDHHSNDPVVAQAKLSLAGLYEDQGKPKQARDLLEEVAVKDPYGSIGAEAGMRLQEINLKHPELVPPPQAPLLPAATGTPTVKPTVTTPSIPATAVPPKAENP